MITVDDYFMGRRKQYPLALTPQIERNAFRTVELLNQLLLRAQSSGVKLHRHPVNKSLMSSGWRPPVLNASVPGAAVNSKHMTAEAGDVYDPDGDLDEWLLTDEGQAALADVGLWMEHPSATKGWSHLQTVPPRSQRRVFYP